MPHPWHIPQVIDGKGMQNTLNRFQQKIKGYLAKAPESEAGEENPSNAAEGKADESSADG